MFVELSDESPGALAVTEAADKKAKSKVCSAVRNFENFICRINLPGNAINLERQPVYLVGANPIHAPAGMSVQDLCQSVRLTMSVSDSD